MRSRRRYYREIKVCCCLVRGSQEKKITIHLRKYIYTHTDFFFWSSFHFLLYKSNLHWEYPPPIVKCFFTVWLTKQINSGTQWLEGLIREQQFLFASQFYQPELHLKIKPLSQTLKKMSVWALTLAAFFSHASFPLSGQDLVGSSSTLEPRIWWAEGS